MQVFAYGRGSAEFDRGVSFFDAIYGFAITLLITTVHVPGASAWTSVHALLKSGFGSQITGFVLSFVVIALFWRLNYRLIGTMRGMTPRIIIANIVCVFFVILVPFTTQALHAPALDGLPLPTALYAANIALVALAQSIMYLIAERSKLTAMSPHTRASSVARYAGDFIAPFVFGFSIVLAYTAGIGVAQYSWLSLAVLMPVLGQLEKRLNHNVMPVTLRPDEATE